MIEPEIPSNAKDFVISFDWHMETSAPGQQNGLRVIMSSLSLEGNKTINWPAWLSCLSLSVSMVPLLLWFTNHRITVTREFERKIPRPKLRDSDSAASGTCCCKAQILRTLNSPQYPLVIQEKKKKYSTWCSQVWYTHNYINWEERLLWRNISNESRLEKFRLLCRELGHLISKALGGRYTMTLRNDRAASDGVFKQVSSWYHRWSQNG